MNTHGIYCLFFETDNYKYYIGKSLDIAYRYSIHCRDLRNKVHHNTHLQNAFNLYKTYPSLEVLEIPDISDLADREIYWINEFDAFYYGYNRTGGGEGAGYGSTSPCAKYDEETYTTILYFLAYTDMTVQEISDDLNVSKSIITSISLGKSHTYLKEKYPEAYAKATDRHGDFSTSRLYDDSVYYRILYDLSNTSDKYNVIAKRYQISEGIVEDIGSGATHRYLKDKYPELYSKMIDKKGKRRAGSQTGLAYPAVKGPDGTIYSDIKNAKQFALEHNLHQGHFGDLLRGKAKSHKGWILA